MLNSRCPGPTASVRGAPSHALGRPACDSLWGDSPPSQETPDGPALAGSSASDRNIPFVGNPPSVTSFQATLGARTQVFRFQRCPDPQRGGAGPPFPLAPCLPARAAPSRPALCSVYLISAAWAGSHQVVAAPREPGPVLGSIQVLLAEPPALRPSRRPGHRPFMCAPRGATGEPGAGGEDSGHGAACQGSALPWKADRAAPEPNACGAARAPAALRGSGPGSPFPTPRTCPAPVPSRSALLLAAGVTG